MHCTVPHSTGKQEECSNSCQSSLNGLECYLVKSPTTKSRLFYFQPIFCIWQHAPPQVPLSIVQKLEAVTFKSFPEASTQQLRRQRKKKTNSVHIYKENLPLRRSERHPASSIPAAGDTQGTLFRRNAQQRAFV